MATKPSPGLRGFEPEEHQLQAIEHVHGPMLVVAGAGTGKTSVLIRRIVRLIRENHARADEILALTYTDNAAAEMRERIQAELHATGSRLQVSTFHAYCNNLLIRNDRGFSVLDDKDLWIFLRKRIRELRLNYFVRAANVSKFLDDLLDFLRRCHDELVSPEKYADYVLRLERGELPIPRVCKSKDVDSLTNDEVVGRCREIAAVFSKVEEMLAAENLGTFGHMITRAYALLGHEPELLAREREHARFILVDEFQDANFAQVKLLQHLSGVEKNIFAVGDPDQAIYRFRGASSAAFALFKHNFPEARIVALEKNRRSTTPILKCAHALIAKNPESFSGTGTALRYKRAPLISAREEEAVRHGQTLPSLPVEVVLFTAGGKDLESSDVVSVVRQRQRQFRCKWSDFAVLYRIHQHRDELVEQLAAQNIPYTVEGMDIMATAEARDVFACLGAVVSADDDASLFRVAALPQFAVDGEALRAGIRSLPRDQEHGGIASVLSQIAGGAAVLDGLQEVREEIARTAAKSRSALEIIIAKFGFQHTSPVLTAIREFVRQWEDRPIVKTKELGELLEYLEYFREARGAIAMASPERDAVRLMTAHCAKGLEFNHVFLLRANSNSFPASYRESLVEFPRELRDADSIAAQDDKTLHDQEERRLLYVAMTRARDGLTIYAKRGTGRDITPAGYLRDLLKDTGLRPYLRQRATREFQTALFAQAGPASATLLSRWVELPPAANLNSKLSASAVQTYETCPLQFKLEREWRIPGEVPAAMQYGASIHRVLRAYYDSVRFGRTMSDDAVIELFLSDLRAAKIQDAYQHDLYENQGMAQLKEFLACCRKRPEVEVLHTEESFEVKLGGTVIAGRIDRMDKSPTGQVAITDYKTGKPQSQEDADESLQLSIYALAAGQKWGYHIDQLAFHNLDDNTRVLTQRSKQQLQEAKLRAEEVAAKIAAGEFEPTTGFHCNFCAYHTLCPATEKRLYSISSADRN
ncbi:MAG TPA: ATP-dependent DNA helicase [Terriglobales bacterium]|nr:ATP-dependent DNA helicase [Terriglobales bacterium]